MGALRGVSIAWRAQLHEKESGCIKDKQTRGSAEQLIEKSFVSRA